MKRLLKAFLAVSCATIVLSGCSSMNEPDKPVASMIDHLYFGDGSYEDYKAAFQDPSKVISKDEFDKIRQKGSKSLFADKSFSDVSQQLRAFQADDKSSVVYYVDFAADKEKDLHWNVVKTDNGWKIKN